VLAEDSSCYCTASVTPRQELTRPTQVVDLPESQLAAIGDAIPAITRFPQRLRRILIGSNRLFGDGASVSRSRADVVLLAHCEVDEPEIQLLDLNVARMPLDGLPRAAFADDARVIERSG